MIANIIYTMIILKMMVCFLITSLQIIVHQFMKSIGDQQKEHLVNHCRPNYDAYQVT